MRKHHAYVVLGNGVAGITAAEIVRKHDPTGAITIIADDPFPAYYRPALKDFLGGRLPEEKLWARPVTFYKEQHLRFLPARVMGIHPAQQTLHLHTGATVHYDTLLLANGARARTLECPGLNLAGVSTLRTVTDYQEILHRLTHVQRVVICGSGTLALESAETLRHRGHQVTHLLRGKTFWSEVLDPVASDMVLQEEQRDGVEVHRGEEITEILGRNGQVCGVITTRGEHIPCEMVLIAIGIEPLVDFLRAGGIACGRGVKVDSTMRTNIPNIYAAGDVVETVDQFSGRARVLGQWFPAIQQAQIAAYSMLTAAGQLHPSGGREPSAGHLYNATLLYGLDFVSVGLTTIPEAPGFQEVVAPPQTRTYQKVILHQGAIVGVLLLGKRGQALAFKRAIDHRVNVAPVAGQLFAEGFDLDAWLSRQGVPEALLTLPQLHLSDVNPAGREQHPRSLSGRHPVAALPIPGEFPHLKGTEGAATASRLLPETLLAQLPQAPTLVLMGPDTPPAPFTLTNQQRYTIGRDPQNDIVLADASVSRQHAEIFRTPDGFAVRDLNSRYGVFLNQRKITNSFHLSHGDRIILGNMLLYVSSPCTPTRGLPEQTPAASRQVVPAGQAMTALTRVDRQAEEHKRVIGLEHRKEIVPLTAERLTFEIDMCIGCNRCMEACPVPISSQVTIADLNSATVTRDVTPTVARFTHECIMCGSCVPVCPVDNHRDLLMLALKQRLGASWESQPDMSRVIQVLPAGWSLPLLLQHLREQSMFHDPRLIPDTYLLHIVAASTQRILAPGEVLLREGEYGRDLYLILEGQLELTTADREQAELAIAILRRGEYTGEDGLLTGRPYRATARAQTPTLLLQAPEQVIHSLMELVPGVRQHFETFTQARSLFTILKSMDLFAGVTEADLQVLVRAAQVRQYDRGERLFAADMRGRPPRETVHVVLEGFVKVARQTPRSERIIAYRQAGDYFAGGLDLLGDGQAVTVTTINRCRIAEVPRQVMLGLFQRYPGVEQQFTVRLQDYLESAASTRGQTQATRALQIRELQPLPVASVPARPQVQQGLHDLVGDGVVEGTEVLIIDLDKCIHCNECEEACARRHGHSRMNRKGKVIGNISITTTCRQCQDPVCMLCSRAGIARHPNGEVYITESCIGCGICAERCPYGAISIVSTTEEEASTQTSWQRFSEWLVKSSGAERVRTLLPVIQPEARERGDAVAGPRDLLPTRSGYDELRKKIAIKCDLCAGYRDQACVEACPAGAALRVQPVKFFGSTEEILQQ